MTSIPYNIAADGMVRLDILNLKGEIVTTLYISIFAKN
jgi:hypothetical protein